MRKNIYDILGERVREERKRTGLTIEQLAESAGISANTEAMPHKVSGTM